MKKSKIAYMPPSLIHYLTSEMKIIWSHFEEKLLSFSLDDQFIAIKKIEEMLDISQLIKSRDSPPNSFKEFFHECEDDSLNEFLQAMYDCFIEWQRYEDIELQKALYAHTNRNTDNWFPVVVIDQVIDEVKFEGNEITLYRGCNYSDFYTKKFTQRQSWTTNLTIAKLFAFAYISNITKPECRIVIKAVVKKDDILWNRIFESEMVVALGFSPISYTIEMTYEDYKNQAHPSQG